MARAVQLTNKRQRICLDVLTQFSQVCNSCDLLVILAICDFLENQLPLFQGHYLKWTLMNFILNHIIICKYNLRQVYWGGHARCHLPSRSCWSSSLRVVSITFEKGSKWMQKPKSWCHVSISSGSSARALSIDLIRIQKRSCARAIMLAITTLWYRLCSMTLLRVKSWGFDNKFEHIVIWTA